MEIIISSDEQDPANFNSLYSNAIDLSDGYEIALKSIFHAPVFNITTDNNRFSIAISNDNSPNQMDVTIVHYEIPLGFYESRCEIVSAMFKSMSDNIHGFELGFISTNPHDRDFVKYKPSIKIENGSIEFNMMNPKSPKNSRDRTLAAVNNLEFKWIVIDPAVYIDSSIMPILGYGHKTKTLLDKISVEDYKLENSSTAGFLYTDIVGNSMINQKHSRLLAIIPMKSTSGHNYYEFKNPTYRELSVHSFSDLNFFLTDVNGDNLKMDSIYLLRRNYPKYILPTILSLHIRKKTEAI